MLSSLASWIRRDNVARFGGGALTVGTYLSLMSRSADMDAELPTLGTYLDSGGLALIADLYRVRIVVRLYGSGGEEIPGSPQFFLPREGVSPTTEVRLCCKVDEHFVLEALETPSQPSPRQRRPRPPPLCLSISRPTTRSPRRSRAAAASSGQSRRRRVGPACSRRPWRPCLRRSSFR